MTPRVVNSGEVGFFLDADDWQLKGGLEIRMCHVGLIESQTHWSNESLVLWRFTSEPLSDITGLRNHSLPSFPS